jgi:hypothetical protein
MRVKKVLTVVALLIIITVSFYLIAQTITNVTGKIIIDKIQPDSLSICLEKQDIKLYINDLNPENRLRRMEARDYLSSIEIHNCIRNNQECLREGIEFNPTWIINNKKIPRDITSEELLEFSGCN